jgi:hypothetical protein
LEITLAHKKEKSASWALVRYNALFLSFFFFFFPFFRFRLLLIAALCAFALAQDSNDPLDFAADLTVPRQPAAPPAEVKKEGIIGSLKKLWKGLTSTKKRDPNAKEKPVIDALKAIGRRIVGKPKKKKNGSIEDGEKKMGLWQVGVQHVRNLVHGNKEGAQKTSGVLLNLLVNAAKKMQAQRKANGKKMPVWFKKLLMRMLDRGLKYVGKVVKKEGRAGNSFFGKLIRAKLENVVRSVREKSCKWTTKNTFGAQMMRHKGAHDVLLQFLKDNWDFFSEYQFFKSEVDQNLMKDLIVYIEEAYVIIQKMHGGDGCKYIIHLGDDRINAYVQYGDRPTSEIKAQRLRYQYRRTVRATHRVLRNNNLEWLDKYLPGVMSTERQTNWRIRQPPHVWLPMVILFGIAFVACSVVFVLALLWKGSAFQIALMSMVGVACAGRVAYWSFWGVEVGESVSSKIINGVSYLANNLVEALASLLFVFVMMLFVFILSRANFKTFYPEKTVVTTVFGIVTLVLGVAFGVYSITISVLVEVKYTKMIFNYSRVFGAVLGCVFASLLLCGFVLTLYHVRKKEGDQTGLMKRTVVFLIASAVLAASFLANLIVVCGYTFVSMGKFKMMFHLNGVAELMLTFCLLTYVFLGIRASRVPRNLHRAEEKGYVPMYEEDGSEISAEASMVIPSRYQDY